MALNLNARRLTLDRLEKGPQGQEKGGSKPLPPNPLKYRARLLASRPAFEAKKLPGLSESQWASWGT